MHSCLWFKLKRMKKGELAFAQFGGVDGTRTRDPRRDRPVF
jgi:hypothetical protein